MKKQNYILAVDQSTQGTKALLFDENARLSQRYDLPHKQIVSDTGYVEHDGEEIYNNMLLAVKQVINESGIDQGAIKAMAISNQRETGIMWGKNGKPLYNAVVWQCARGQQICAKLAQQGKAEQIQQKTGLKLSPYFTAAKLSWLLQNVSEIKNAFKENNLLAGTMDAYLVYRLTGNHATDYSNASRTQLFNIDTLQWDTQLCSAFAVPQEILPRVQDSNSVFGYTDIEGILPNKIPICGIMGDSHAALYAQGCIKNGMAKGTYGTGSSVMINTGEARLYSDTLVTSLAWQIDGKPSYVLEGNINYTGAAITWLVENLQLIQNAKEVEPLAQSVENNGGVYLVPALSGLGAPYWNSDAKAMLCGMSRTTTKAHIARAVEECIAYQITDIVNEARKAGVELNQLRADGGPTKDKLLMQFQADQLQMPVMASTTVELSGAGVAYAAGIKIGVFTQEVVNKAYEAIEYVQSSTKEDAYALYKGWKNAVKATLYQAEL